MLPLIKINRAMILKRFGYAWTGNEANSSQFSWLVVALLLNIIPHVVQPVDVWYCLVAGPTLMISLLIMVLYIVDQVQYEAELYYVVIEIIVTVLAFINLLLVGKLKGAIYGLFYVDLLIAFSMDIYYMHKERGWTF